MELSTQDLLMLTGKLYVEKETVLVQVAELRARVAELEGELVSLSDAGCYADKEPDES